MKKLNIHLQEANNAWKQIRNLSIQEEDIVKAKSVLGSRGYENMMQSGIIGYKSLLISIMLK